MCLIIILCFDHCEIKISDSYGRRNVPYKAAYWAPSTLFGDDKHIATTQNILNCTLLSLFYGSAWFIQPIANLLINCVHYLLYNIHRDVCRLLKWKKNCTTRKFYRKKINVKNRFLFYSNSLPIGDTHKQYEIWLVVHGYTDTGRKIPMKTWTCNGTHTHANRLEIWNGYSKHFHSRKQHIIIIG